MVNQSNLVDGNKFLATLINICDRRLIEHEELLGILDRPAIRKVVDREVQIIGEDYGHQFDADEVNQAIARLEARRLVKVAVPMSSLSGGSVTPWSEIGKMNWPLWTSYRKFLLDEGRSADVIRDNERLVDEVLRLSGDPATEGPWLRKGLVMGNVQSGKTMNFIGLVNKALDAGYHTIIILGGHLNELRQQTQERVDEGALGQNTGEFVFQGKKMLAVASRNYGVACFDELSGDEEIERPHAGTTHAKDFGASTAKSLALNINAKTPTVFVIKKNVAIMRNLCAWLLERLNETGRNAPMLLIDDEADYASINTKYSKDEVAATNEQILSLLDNFTRRVYVGYTATPFANVFIPTYEAKSDEDKVDLFPADFMLKMPIPDNYCGQDYFFPQELEDVEAEVDGPVRIIDDFAGWLDLKHKKDVEIQFIPNSLKDAILTFLLAVAVRYARGDQDVHNTMLVNVSRFNDVQAKVTSEILAFLDTTRDNIVAYGRLDSELRREHSLLNRLESIYFDEYSNADIDLEEIIRILIDNRERFKVVMVNGLSKKRIAEGAVQLDYRGNSDKGLWVIAIGGQKLSRGLTLEGLSVSYFLRNALAYDTLTQMCRWFGYRPGYSDLCRLWITSESEQHYYTVSDAIRELYKDLEIMKHSGATPRHFGLRVKADDLSLLVTAKNKMGTGQQITMQTVLWEKTWRKMAAFRAEKINSENFRIFERLVTEVSERDCSKVSNLNTGKPIIIEGAGYDDLISLLQDTKFPDQGPRTVKEPVLAALKQMHQVGLAAPVIFVFNQSSSKMDKRRRLSDADMEKFNEPVSFAGWNIVPRTRKLEADSNYYYEPRQTVGDKDDLKFCFSESEIREMTEELGRSDSAGLINSEMKGYVKAPILKIYLLRGLGEHQSDLTTHRIIHQDNPTVVFSIQFPNKAKGMVEAGLKDDANLRELDRERSYFANEVLRNVTIDDGSDEDDFEDD
ncbi:Z1 domain-containing protein [Pseudomonadales bacterium]|nr:Z1 domain-containing protein [Pseudomonadales bacterium]